MVSGEFLEETGVVAKALGPAEPGEQLQEQLLAPNQAAVVDGGSFSWNSPSKLALGGGRALYRIHLPFTLQFQAQNLAAVTYTVSDGQFEKKLYADEMEEEAFQERVGLVNRSGGRRWGYETCGGALRLPAGTEEAEREEWSIELSLTEDASLSSYEIETMFREKISRLEIYVTLEFEDGSAAGPSCASAYRVRRRQPGGIGSPAKAEAVLMVKYEKKRRANGLARRFGFVL